MALFRPLHPELDRSLYDDTPVLDLGCKGSGFLMALLTDWGPGELLCCERAGRGTFAKRLSSELASVEEGSVEVEPCWPLA
jgi:hypothetical protein